MPSIVKPPSTGVRLMTIATLSVLAVVLAGLAACFILTVHVENSDRVLHDEQRKGSCETALFIVQHQLNTNDSRNAGLALYDATGCPLVLQQLGIKA